MFGCGRLARVLLVTTVVALATGLTPVAAAASRGSSEAAVPTAAPPPFSCAEQGGGSVTGMPSAVHTVRVGAHRRFDRFVISLRGPLQQFDVRPQDSSTFFLDPSGIPVTLQGTAGLRVVIHGAQAHHGFRGPTDITPGLPVLLEARQIGDFEGVVSWGLGLSRASCFRVLARPRALVVDVQH
jgi:hypothetical protein